MSEKYSNEKAQEDAEELRKKVESGEVSSYAEAEEQLENKITASNKKSGESLSSGESIEKPSKKIGDFVVETKMILDEKRGEQFEFRFIDADKLASAMEEGLISEEEVYSCFYPGRATLAEQIEEREKEVQENPDSWYHMDLEILREMQKVNPHYIPSGGNLDFRIYSDDEKQLQDDFIEYLSTKEVEIIENVVEKDGPFLFKSSKRKIDLSEMPRIIKEKGFYGIRGWLTLVLNYPSLAHTITLNGISRDRDSGSLGDRLLSGKKYKLSNTINPGAMQREGKIECSPDFLSLLHMLIYFKSKGYEVRLQLYQNPLNKDYKETKKRLYYFAR